jgi:hypothetical protein
MSLYVVVCGSAVLRQFFTRAEADAFALSWTKYGAQARVVVRAA